MNAVAAYAAKRAIVDMLHTRALGADRFDVALMRACHPLDATDNHGTAIGLMHDFIDQLEERARTGPPCRIKQHVVANALVELRSADDAFAESYHVAHEAFEEERGVTDYWIGGRYLDRFRRIDGRWLIQHRDVVYDWSRVMPATAPVFPQTGTRTAGDPLYRARPSWRGALHPTLQIKDHDMDDALQQLLDKQAIAEVLYRRARAGDRVHRCRLLHPAQARHADEDHASRRH